MLIVRIIKTLVELILEKHWYFPQYGKHYKNFPQCGRFNPHGFPKYGEYNLKLSNEDITIKDISTKL